MGFWGCGGMTGLNGFASFRASIYAGRDSRRSNISTFLFPRFIDIKSFSLPQTAKSQAIRTVLFSDLDLNKITRLI